MILAPNYKVTLSTFQPLVRLVDEGGQANAYAWQPRDWFLLKTLATVISHTLPSLPQRLECRDRRLSTGSESPCSLCLPFPCLRQARKPFLVVTFQEHQSGRLLLSRGGRVSS